MTHNEIVDGTPPARPTGSGPLGYGMLPVMTVGGLLGLLIVGLAVGGAGVAGAMTTDETAAPGPTAAIPTTAPPTPVPGDEVPGTDDPVPPPDRDSDQTGVPAPSDQVYYILEGDTLTELSAQFGMSVDYLADYNAVRDVDVISEGAALRVPFIYIPLAQP